MKATLQYTHKYADGIIGELSFDDGYFCVTLSHAYQQPDGSYEPIVQAGTYTCKFGHHELGSGPIDTYEILGIEGHSGLLFHPGNFNKDSHGCTLLGQEVMQSAEGHMITKSRFIFTAFIAKLQGADTFELEVI